MNIAAPRTRLAFRPGIVPTSGAANDVAVNIAPQIVTSPSAEVEVPAIWKESFTVRSYEVGPNYGATTQTLMDYFQEAAGNHTRLSKLDGGVDSGWVWVMLRFRLRVYERPMWRSTVTIETWARGFRGVRAERCFRFLDEKGSVLAEGTSYWASIDLVRRRPVRPPAELVHMPTCDIKTPNLDERLTPGAPMATIKEVDFYVRKSDLDVNQHVNNVCYLDWALEAVPTAFREDNRLTEIDLAFKAESVYGDTILSTVGNGEHGTLMHQLARESDGRVLAWVRTWWT